MRGLAVAGLLITLVACGGTAESPAEPPPAAAPRGPSTPSARDARCTAAPLTVRVDGIRREGADSLRVELTLVHVAAGGAAGAPVAGPEGVDAAVRAALDGMSLVTADGRRRLFALHSSAGERVGPPVEALPPGGSLAVWALFPTAEGPLTVLLPGCAPLTGLAVTPGIRAGRPEP